MGEGPFDVGDILACDNRNWIGDDCLKDIGRQNAVGKRVLQRRAGFALGLELGVKRQDQPVPWIKMR